MTTNNSPPQTPGPPAPNKRRSSIADLFQPRSSSTTNTNNGTPAFPSAMGTAMQQNRQNPRRMSVSTSLGLSGSPNSQSSPFGSFSRRRDSITSSQDTGSPGNEEAILEDNDNSGQSNTTPTSPFARRVSFGAQAYGNVRSSRGSFSNGIRPSLSPLTEKPSNQSSVSRSASTSTSGKSRGDGFKWGDNLREKSGRPGPNASPTAGRSGSPPAPQQHQRAAGIAHVEPPKQMSAQPVHYAKPDVLGERMLRGDFMMD